MWKRIQANLGYILIVVYFIALMAGILFTSSLILALWKDVEQNGLKSIVHEVWEGKKEK